MRPGRLASVILPAIMFAVLAVDGAAAASTICTRLEARLAAIDSGRQPSGGRYGRAAEEQRLALRRARSQARQAGCREGGFLFFRSRQDGRCEALLDRISSMEGNLARLERRAGGASGPATRRERKATLQALAENNCGARYARAGAGERRGGLFSRDGHYDRQGIWVPGGRDRRERAAAAEDHAGGSGRRGGSGYRTLCVRTCDGYYFPISASTSESNFAQDEQACQARCPGTEVELYSHRSWSENVGDAVSVSGTRYSELPSAFAYRSTYNPACTCRGATKSAMSFIAGGYDNASFMALPADGSVPPVPERKPGRGEDPETLANRAGDFDPAEAIAPPVRTPVASLDGPPGEPSEIRRVGPSYFYAQ